VSVLTVAEAEKIILKKGCMIYKYQASKLETNCQIGMKYTLFYIIQTCVFLVYQMYTLLVGLLS
jgi:hypothetical protein